MQTETKKEWFHHIDKSGVFSLIGIFLCVVVIFIGMYQIHQNNENMNATLEKFNHQLEQENKEVYALAKKGKLKRTTVEVLAFHYTKKEFTPLTTENDELRKWEEGNVSFYPYYIHLLNNKGNITEYYTNVTIQLDKKINKPEYSYYEYKGNIYNPILRLPYENKEKIIHQKPIN